VVRLPSSASLETVCRAAGDWFLQWGLSLSSKGGSGRGAPGTRAVRERATSWLLTLRQWGAAVLVPISEFTDPLFASVRVFLSPTRKIPGSRRRFCQLTWPPSWQLPLVPLGHGDAPVWRPWSPGHRVSTGQGGDAQRLCLNPLCSRLQRAFVHRRATGSLRAVSPVVGAKVDAQKSRQCFRLYLSTCRQQAGVLQVVPRRLRSQRVGKGSAAEQQLCRGASERRAGGSALPCARAQPQPGPWGTWERGPGTAAARQQCGREVTMASSC